MEDIFEYAKGIVNNKSVAARIGHSGKLHSIRSALSGKGSAASKFGSLVGVAVRATLNAIPIPAVGSLISAAEKAVQDKIRGTMHQRNLDRARASGDKATVVKFEIKELTLEDMDRFRWKVSHAMTELNAAIAKFPENYAKKRDEGATCDAYLELVIAAEQASRRINKLKEKVMAINTVVKLTCDWIEECERGPRPAGALVPVVAAPAAGPATAGVLGKKNEIQALIRGHIDEDNGNLAKGERHRQTQLEKSQFHEAYVSAYHAKCDRWCCYRAAGAVDDWQGFRNNAAIVVRFLSDPFVPDDFNNNLGSLWKTGGS